MEREKEQMLREKEELMLRLQDYEQKTKRAEKGQELGLPTPSHPTPHSHDGVGPQPRGDLIKRVVCLTQLPKIGDNAAIEIRQWSCALNVCAWHI